MLVVCLEIHTGGTSAPKAKNKLWAPFGSNSPEPCKAFLSASASLAGSVLFAGFSVPWNSG